MGSGIICSLDIVAKTDDDSDVNYPGGKGKTYPRIINLMPPHTIYIETHLGGGAVMRHKLPATEQVGIELNSAIAKKWQLKYPGVCDVLCTDAVSFLESACLPETALIYADPPYVSSTRRRSRVYRHDYSDRDHERLLNCLKEQRCMVMVSGYASPLYDSMLRDWRRISYRAKTHQDFREEFVWLNYVSPSRLHDERYRGVTSRDRHTLRRRIRRLQDRIEKLSLFEKKELGDWFLATRREQNASND